MNDEERQTLRDIFGNQQVAALGTLHAGEPFVSMVPFAWLPDGSALVIHVSQLASHTADMLHSPRVSVVVMADGSDDVPPQARPRATVRGDAFREPSESPDYDRAKAAYLERFPAAEGIFELTDFSIFTIRPLAIRLIGGFARATTITPEDLASALRLA